MERSEAIEYCKAHFLLYQGMAKGLLYTDYCADVAILIDGAKGSNSSLIRWGSLFVACQKSRCFHPMELSAFREMLRGVLPGNPPALSTLKSGKEQITMAFQASGNKRDNEEKRQWRENTIDLANAIRSACHQPPLEML